MSSDEGRSPDTSPTELDATPRFVAKRASRGGRADRRLRASHNALCGLDRGPAPSGLGSRASGDEHGLVKVGVARGHPFGGFQAGALGRFDETAGGQCAVPGCAVGYFPSRLGLGEDQKANRVEQTVGRFPLVDSHDELAWRARDIDRREGSAAFGKRGLIVPGACDQQPSGPELVAHLLDHEVDVILVEQMRDGVVARHDDIKVAGKRAEVSEVSDHGLQ